jgi:hypothetical protein
VALAPAEVETRLAFPPGILLALPDNTVPAKHAAGPEKDEKAWGNYQKSRQGDFTMVRPTKDCPEKYHQQGGTPKSWSKAVPNGESEDAPPDGSYGMRPISHAY